MTKPHQSMPARGRVTGSLAAVTAAVLLVAVPGGARAGDSDAQSGVTLRYGSPQQAGLLPEHVARILPDVRAGLAPVDGRRPLYPGAVVLAGRRGVVVEHEAVGHAVRYASSRGDELPPEQWIPMRPDTIVDMASISKLFTAVAAMQQVEAGRLDLDAPVARYIPEFAQNGKQDVTVRHVMTHTAGLPPGLNLNPYPTIEERLAAVYAVGLRAQPGTRYIYSDLSMIVAGKVLERITGRSLDVLVRDGISEPLGLSDTMHNPPASLRHRIAATEWQEGGRGLIWGEVHDRTSWLLGGTAGHAGVFSTAYDLAVFTQMLLNGGRYGEASILRPDSVRAMVTNQNAALGPGTERGLGFDVYKHSFMGAMATPHAAGHTGYTGPSVVLDPTSDSFAILLTNRVHPHRSWSSVGPPRRAVAGHVARATPVHPAEGSAAWFSGMVDERVATLGLTLPPGGDGLEFAYWWDTEPGYDTASVEVSLDGGATWNPLPVTLRPGVGPGDSDAETSQDADGTVSGYQGRRWYRATASLPDGATHVRWRYVTDGAYLGRGVYVDAVRVRTAGHVVFDDSVPLDRGRWRADGFAPSAN